MGTATSKQWPPNSDHPPPPLSSKKLGAAVPSHCRGNLTQVTVPSAPPPPPPITRQETCDTKQESEHEGMCTTK